MRHLISNPRLHVTLFQSTHPVWDATIDANTDAADALQFQSTHPVWDATTIQTEGMTNARISIHASRMGCDADFVDDVSFRHISIHASRMGCDGVSDGQQDLHPNFNPRIPYGMRLGGRGGYTVIFGFQSTHPVWDATISVLRILWDDGGISIHASRMGCDQVAELQSHGVRDFNPRIPYGMRHGIMPQFQVFMVK